MSEGASIWQVLGIEMTHDPREIRRAYARRLKVTQPEDDAEGFQRLRVAYEYALAWAVHASRERAEGHLPERTAAAPAPPPEPEPERMPESPPVPAPLTQAEPEAPAHVPIDHELAAKADADVHELQRLFEALRARLDKNARDGWPDVDGDARALAALVRAPALHNIALQLQAEEAIAVMLLQHAPHGDHLLAAAARHFEWLGREHESSLAPPARAVLERMDDRAFLDHLRDASNEASLAYETLRNPTSRLTRWWAAFGSHRHEVAMLQFLQARHPRLLAELPRENVEWYSRIEMLPRPSKALLLIGIIAISVAMIGAWANTPGGEDRGDYVLKTLFLGFAILFVVMVFDYFVLKLPPALVEQRWRGDPPAWLGWGWLWLSLVTIAGAMATRSISWGPPLSLGLALLSNYAALLVGGRAPHVQWRGGDLLQYRVVRLVLMNALMFIWLGMSLNEALHLDNLVLAAFMLIVIGSGVARPLFTRLYATRFEPLVQMRMAAAGLAVSILLIASAWLFGREPGFRPWLVAAVVAVVLLRRAIPHGIAINGNPWTGSFVVLVGGLICAWLSGEFQLELRQGEYGDPPLLVGGAIFFLSGAVYAFARAIHDAVGQLRNLLAVRV